MALSFCYSPAISSQYRPCSYDKDEIEKTCQSIKTTCHITFNEPNITLTGNDFMSTRSKLLQTCPLKVQLTVTIPYTLSSKQLETLERETDTLIRLQNKSQAHAYFSCLHKVIVVGTPQQVEQCRVRLLVLINEMKSSSIESIELPIQYLICGRKRAGLLPIIEETSTNIYFPSPFGTSHIIYMTGDHVSRVKDMLHKLSIQKQKSMYHKDTALYARKIDWLLLHRRDELRKIMHDNGSFILFPKIGSNDNRVTVYAENRVNAERTLRALNFQACFIYEAYFYFNNKLSSTDLVTPLSQVSGAEVIFNEDCIEVLGTERAIRNVYQRLQEMQFLQVFHKHTLFRVESSNEQRDFISGKKNGKINKIMKTSGAKIKFLPFINDYNFMIEVESTSFTKALDGLTLLQEELPAEISFYVPESYHKRIIGVGGKNIQRIMKKYGVYVKFSNTEEFAALGGYYHNQDNVVARTPMKNQINLDNLRHAVMELIHPKDRNYIIQTIQIPYYLHTRLIHEFQSSFITDEILKKTNTTVLWPDAELACDTVELLGPELHIPVAIEMLETIIPEEYVVHVPKSSIFDEIIASESFQKKVISPIQALGIQLNHIDNKRKEEESQEESQEEKSVETSKANTDLLHILEKKNEQKQEEEKEEGTNNHKDNLFVFSMTRNKITEALPKALSIFIDHLEQHNVPLYQDTLTKTVNPIRADKTDSEPKGTVLDQLRSIHDHPVYNYTKKSYSFFTPNERMMDWMLPPPKRDDLRAIFDAPIRYHPPIGFPSGSTVSTPGAHPPPPPNFGFPPPPPSTVSSAPTSVTNTSSSNDIWANHLSKRRPAGFPSSSSTHSTTSNNNINSNNSSSNNNIKMSSSSTSNDNNNIHQQMIFDQSGFYPMMSSHIASKEFDPYSDLKPSLSDSTSDHLQPRLKTEGFQSSVLYQPPTTFTPPVNQPTQFFAKAEQVNVQDMLDTLSSTTSGSTGFDPRRPPSDQENKGSRPPPGIDI